MIVLKRRGKEEGTEAREGSDLVRIGVRAVGLGAAGAGAGAAGCGCGCGCGCG